MLATQPTSPLAPQSMPKFGKKAPNQGTGKAIKRWLITRSNYIDQRSVVTKYGNPVNPMMMAVGAGYTAWHAYKAQPEERKKTLIQDALVLTAAIGGSILAAKRFKPLKEEGALLVEHAKKNLGLDGELTDEAAEFLEKFGHTELPDKLKAFFKGIDNEERLTGEKLEELYDKVKAVKGIGSKRVGEVFENLFDDGEGFTEELGEALKFFGIGGIGVLSGIAGGLVANKINGVTNPDAVPNMIKEGIFQFVANIALCAVGAGAALGLLNSDKLPGQAGKIASHFTDRINNSPLKKLYRTGIVMAGLSVGILGGSHLANYIGQNHVNPLLDKLQGKPPSEQKPDKRKLEVCDVVLHADDIPTALAIAGTAVLGPWIIPFFPVSGYRAGIGYRNDESAKKPKGLPPEQQSPNHFAYPNGASVNGSPAFASYYPKANGVYSQPYNRPGYYGQQSNQTFAAHPSQQPVPQFRY